VAGLGVRIFTDEHIPADLARAVTNRGYDVESCQDAGRANQEISDEEQLAYSARHGRAILTFDRTDFLRLEGEWKRAGREHAGIVIAVNVREIGELLRRVERHLNTYPPSIQNNTLLWLDPSPPH